MRSLAPLLPFVLALAHLQTAQAAPPDAGQLLALQVSAKAAAPTSPPVSEGTKAAKPKLLVKRNKNLGMLGFEDDDSDLAKREPFRAAQPVTKRSPEPFRAPPVPKPDRPAQPHGKREPEPFRAPPVPKPVKPSSPTDSKRDQTYWSEEESDEADEEWECEDDEDSPNWKRDGEEGVDLVKREPFRATQPVTKRAAEPEPFRAAQPVTKRDPAPFRAVATKRNAEPEPFRAVATKRNAEPEPFRAAATKREVEPDFPFKGVEKRQPEPEPFRAVATKRAEGADAPEGLAKRDPGSPYHPPFLERPAHHIGRSGSGSIPAMDHLKRNPFPNPDALLAVVQAHNRAGMRKVAKKRDLNSFETLLDRRAEHNRPEERDTQYAYMAPSSSASNDDSTTYYSVSDTSTPTAVVAAASSKASSAAASTSTSTSSTLNGYWYGASSYYLFSLADSDRYAVLDQLVDGGFKVVRIFIASVYANNKGSDNVAVNDLEPNAVGTYDDTILTKIDQLMYDCKARGLKLLIALSDRYALGFWSTDAYALKYNIVKSGTSGAQEVSDASVFYTSSSAISDFNNRLNHILSHKNALLGGKTWAQLNDVIYAFEAQNEPQGHMTMASSTWVCDRSKYIKSLLPSNSTILVSSGGGITLQASLQSWATSCSSIDIISVHDYGTDADTTVSALKTARTGVAAGKTLMLGEWGITGANKAELVSEFVAALKNAQIPWMHWEVVIPGKKAADFEVWTDEPSWGALTSDAGNAGVTTASSTYAAASAQKSSTSTIWRREK
ncbi:hypothetical protein T439DRAFT_326171 [Meredithblackwellia eburnea MCA 4105]